MLGSPTLATALRFGVFAALQVLVLSRVGLGSAWGAYLQPLLYPVVILLLPVGMPTVFVLLIAFALGTAVDVPLGTYGVHAAALLVTAFARGLALALLEPREGYAVGQSPNRATFGWRWFVSYAAILLGVHVLTYFSIEVFTFVFFGEILLRALGSFVVSLALVILYVAVFDPRA